jgi:hypothetical protein
MQVTMDGNNTQKHIERTLSQSNLAGSTSFINVERHDDHRVLGDYYLTPEQVNVFANEVPR